MPVLSNIHPEFEGMGISAIDDTSNILTGRPYGGVAILIRKLLRPVCEFEFYDDTRMIGLEVKHLKERLYFINVYLPYQCPDNYDVYAEYLGKISAIVEDCHSTKIAIIGDFNAAVGTTFEDELLELCTHHKLIIADYEKYGRTSNQFTYVSDAHSTTSWLDHIICSFDFYSIISDLFILDKLPSSDHLPLCCTCRFELDLELSDSSGVGVIVPSTNYQWCKASDAEIDNYRLRSQILLSEINIPDVVRCYNTACVCNEHKVQLDDYYSSICEALRKASIKSIPTSIFKCSSDYIVPGFNEYVRELHDIARSSYLVWRQSGKPRGDVTEGDMRTSRLRFKYALRQCQNNDEIMRADALARSLYCKDSVSFWKGVRGVNCNNIPLTTKVGDAVGSKNITQLWQDHFSTLLNSVPNIDSKEFVCENIEHGVSDVSMPVVSASDVLDSLKAVKLGKAAGIDGLSAEHFVCAHTSVSVHLSLLFTSMLSHGHMPAGLMKTAIVPILKNRQGDTSDKNNYRPIAIVIALSKIFELCIMRMIETHLVTSDNQFGFKREHGTDLCIYTVKSVIKYYNLHNSPVHTCFLDASKAYDRVNHWTLFKKLLDRSVHILVVRMLMFWYTRQELCIKWGAEMSSFFTISNGVRQGGILSPSLFAVYMDDLSSLLNASRIGCHISDVCINHVFYADDLCLMAPCAIALQELLNICYRYSVEVNLNFNATMSFCVAFTPKHYKLSLPPLFMNISPIMYTDSIKYLGFTFTSNHCDDADILKQMRMLYCRSNRLVRLFNKCSKPVLLELCRSFCTIFYWGHSVSNHPKKMKFETVPPQILMKIYTFGLYGQKRRFAK